MSTLPPVALLNVDSPIGLTIMRELGLHGVPVIAIGRTARSLGRRSRHAHQFVERPDGPIAEWLPALAQQHGFSRMMAVSEGDLLQLAQLKAMPDCPVQLAVPDLAKLQLVLGKDLIAREAQKVGIAVPKSWSPTSSDPLELGGITYPAAIKWADPNAVTGRLAQQGIDFIKVEYAQDAVALQAALSRYDAFGEYPLVQQYCRGFGLGQMFHMKDGRATLRFQHRRLREWPLSGGVSSFCTSLRSDEHPELMAQSERLLKEIDWKGPAMVEYKFDPDTGTGWLMEINGRFWGSQPLASAAGAQFGWETYRHAFLDERQSDAEAGWTRRKARYAAPELKNLLDVARSDWSTARKLRFAGQFAADYFDPRAGWYVWSWDDPKPFLYETVNMFRRGGR